MKDIIVSKNTNSIVKSGQVLKGLQKIDIRLQESEERTKGLLIGLDNSKSEITQVANGDKGRTWLFNNIKNEALLELIQKENKAVSKTVSSISKLIENSNTNTRVQSEMIAGLAMLSAMSFKQLSESASEIEGLSELLSENSDSDYKRDGQIGGIVKHHIKNKKEENAWKQSVEYNFSAINENIQDVAIKIDEHKSDLIKVAKNTNELKDFVNNETKDIQKLINSNSEEYKSDLIKVTKNTNELKDFVNNETKDIQKLIDSNSEEHFIKVLTVQKKQIFTLFIISSLLLIGLLFLGFKFLQIKG